MWRVLDLFGHLDHIDPTDKQCPESKQNTHYPWYTKHVRHTRPRTYSTQLHRHHPLTLESYNHAIHTHKQGYMCMHIRNKLPTASHHITRHDTTRNEPQVIRPYDTTHAKQDPITERERRHRRKKNIMTKHTTRTTHQ